MASSWFCATHPPRRVYPDELQAATPSDSVPAVLITTEEFIEPFPSEIAHNTSPPRQTAPTAALGPIASGARAAVTGALSTAGIFAIGVARAMRRKWPYPRGPRLQLPVEPATARVLMTLAVPIAGVTVFVWLLPTPVRPTLTVAAKEPVWATLSPPLDGLLMSAPANARGVIEQTLNAYRDALSTMDAEAVRQLWPQVNGPTLRAELDRLHDQNLQFDTCRIALGWATATAMCEGSRSYVGAARPRRRRAEARHWQFRLARRGERWTITRVAAGAPGGELAPALF